MHKKSVQTSGQESDFKKICSGRKDKTPILNVTPIVFSRHTCITSFQNMLLGEVKCCLHWVVSGVTASYQARAPELLLLLQQPSENAKQTSSDLQRTFMLTEQENITCTMHILNLEVCKLFILFLQQATRSHSLIQFDLPMEKLKRLLNWS